MLLTSTGSSSIFETVVSEGKTCSLTCRLSVTKIGQGKRTGLYKIRLRRRGKGAKEYHKTEDLLWGISIRFESIPLDSNWLLYLQPKLRKL